MFLILTGCAHQLDTRGMQKINRIQIDPSRRISERQKLNLIVYTGIRVNSGTETSYDHVVQKKIEAALNTSLENLGMFEKIENDFNNNADLFINSSFRFYHKAVDDLQYMPLSMLTQLLYTPSHVETQGVAEIVIISPFSTREIKETFTESGTGKTSTGIFGQGDAAAKAIKQISSKLVDRITEFIQKKYDDLKQISQAKASAREVGIAK